MTTKLTEIDKAALEPVLTARTKAVDLAQAAEQAMKDARLAELEFKVQIQQLYLEKGLEANCRVDITTGAVTWPEGESVDAPAAEVPAAAEDAPKRKRVSKKTSKE